MNRTYNFSPGPSMLPLPVLEKAQKEMLCYQNTGMSVMEMSHRSKMYLEIYEQAKERLRDVMCIPDDYDILFLQGGATEQFSAVPLNLTQKGEADYIDSGNFASIAAKEASKYTKVQIVATSEQDMYTYIPDWHGKLNPNADYLHITTNNTIFGTRYVVLPDAGAVPLVADMSSNILSEVYDVTKFGVIYAGAQKNMGAAGLGVVIVRKDILGYASPLCPKLMNWAMQSKNDSMINTPNTYAIYIAGLCFEWLQAQGGVSAIEKINIEKAQLLYNYIEESRLFRSPVQKEYRSRMNIPFVTGDASKDDTFVKEAAKVGLLNLKGHRVVGGMRASIYNAMPVEGVMALVSFMKAFESAN